MAKRTGKAISPARKRQEEPLNDRWTRRYLKKVLEGQIPKEILDTFRMKITLKVK